MNEYRARQMEPKKKRIRFNREGFVFFDGLCLCFETLYINLKGLAIYKYYRSQLCRNTIQFGVVDSIPNSLFQK